MRPLRLTMRGLRSYRGECTIDFRGRDLVAIVGDTGAGKSSILEGLTYALYNASTWDRRAGQLISDGVQSMSVELAFQAGGQVWSVHRACHRGAGRPSVHRLRCLSDPAAAEHDGEAAVNQQVERLLGMSYTAYLAAVVLPQGRFQQLLVAPPAARTGILEGIFRLDDLRAVRTAARDLHQRAEAAVSEAAGRRQELLPDPAGAARARSAELESLRGRESELAALQAEAAGARETVREATRRAADLRALASLATGPEGGAARRLDELVPLAAAIREALREAAAREADARQREQRAVAAAEAGDRVEDLAAAAEVLSGARRELLDLETADRTAARERAQLDRDAEGLRKAAAAVPGLEAAWRAAREAAEAAARELDDQRELRRRVAEALRATREALASLDAAGVEEARRRAALPACEERVAGGRERVAAAERTLEDRRRELDEARRRDAAAHAAEGLRPGDECPVCRRPLTEDFQPPTVGAFEPLQRAAQEADAALARERTAAAAAAHALDEAVRRLAEAITARETADRAVQERLVALRAAAPEADPVADDAAILGPIDARGRALREGADGCARDAEQARELLTAATTALGARQESHDRTVARLDEQRTRDQERRARVRERLAALPAGLAVPEAAGAADVDAPIATAARLVEEARARRRELEQLRAGVVEAAAAGAALARRLRDEVEGPRGQAMRGAAELLVRVNDGLGALGRPALEAAPAESTIEADAAWAAALDGAAAELRRRTREEVEAIERTNAAAAAALGRRLAAHGLADTNALDGELLQVSRQVGGVQADMERAEAQIPRAAELDARLADGVEVRDSLAELARLLQDSQFVSHVIERRQRQLLVVASQILRSMTGDAYGFAANFEIVDLFTNQPRPTRTLSGGETFLASLALALSLVEIAARSGTHLDALFLDEGFGSLDANALDEALSALELQASEGRLVAVVSHVRAVAERIETVLEVTRSATGSQAQWRGLDEREQLLARELEARLLA